MYRVQSERNFNNYKFKYCKKKNQQKNENKKQKVEQKDIRQKYFHQKFLKKKGELNIINKDINSFDRFKMYRPKETVGKNSNK